MSHPRADLAEAYTSECECGCPVLIREPQPKKGDTFKCPECKTIDVVDGIFSDIRKDQTPHELEVASISLID